MAKTLAHMRKGFSPLPIRDGLNPTRVRVPATLAPVTAWDFLTHVISSQRHRHPADNAAALTRRFHAGEVVTRDGTTLAPDSLLGAETDVYFYRIPAPETPVPYDIKIVFEDAHILVADKPPFLATMPRARHITETATVRLRRLTGIDELSPAHRLDRLTSGLVLFTKSRHVRGAYQTLFARREVVKTYGAIAKQCEIAVPTEWASRMEKTPGEIQGRITAGEPNAFTTLLDVAPLDSQDNLEAIYGPLPPLARYTLRPHTGKTHQLRLHMWAAGIPILGDPVYPAILPADAEDFLRPMHLTAKEITFIDPLSDKPRRFKSSIDLISGSVHS